MAQIKVVRRKDDWGDYHLEDYDLAPGAWDLLARKDPGRYRVLILDQEDLDRYCAAADAWRAEQTRLAAL